VLSAATAALDGFVGAFGFGIVSENAFNAGVASVPTPVTDIAWDGWLWWQAICIKNSDGVESNQFGITRVYQVDSKAMRKFKQSDILMCVFEAESETGIATLGATLKSRLLFKLA